MKTKLESGKENYNKLQDILSCPHCKETLSVESNSLKCINKHTFNLNKKGIISFSQAMKDETYNKELFVARNHVLTSGIYDAIFGRLNKLIDDSAQYLVDTGCGEGTYLHEIKKSYPQLNTLGIDLAIDGLNVASDYRDSAWMLADLAKLPLKDASVDIMLNILSPANYNEFKRVLKNNGILIKVIVNQDYLKEIREISEQAPHSNENVLEILRTQMEIIHEEDIKYTTAVTKTLSKDLIKMTPMTQNYNDDIELSTITIDLKIVVCRKK